MLVAFKAFLQTSAKMPWCIGIVSDKTADILASKTILNLDEPTKYLYTSFIKMEWKFNELFKFSFRFYLY